MRQPARDSAHDPHRWPNHPRHLCAMRRLIPTAARILIALAVAGVVALPTTQSAMAATPSFDCGKVGGQIEKLICHDDTLAALDRETARLYRLARGTPGMTARQSNELAATQRGWIKGRNVCWKADDRETCVRDRTLARVYELRRDLSRRPQPGQGWRQPRTMVFLL